jgi:predicted DNA-binding transcriptional regulator AlpA
MPDSSILNERQAAGMLGCSVALMRKWRRLGQGPSYRKLGRLVRYTQADIQAFLDAQLVTTGGGL